MSSYEKVPCHVHCHKAQRSKQEISTSREKYRSCMGQGGAFSWEASCFQSKMKDFLRESFWSVEVMHFLLFSPVLLVATLRFMTAYVIPGPVDVKHPLWHSCLSNVCRSPRPLSRAVGGGCLLQGCAMSRPCRRGKEDGRACSSWP